MQRIRVHYLACAAPGAGPAPEARLPGARHAIARERPDRAAYLDLYRAVGASLHWDQRLRMPGADLDAWLADTACAIHVLRVDGEPAGMCEIDRGGLPRVQVVNFGIVPAWYGHGLGPLLLHTALADARDAGARAAWLHTDEWDHPGALACYRRAGFAIERTALEHPDSL